MTKPFDPTKLVRTRDGLKVRIICTDHKGSPYPIIALVDINGEEELIRYTSVGRQYMAHETNKDLINFEPKIEVVIWRSHAGDLMASSTLTPEAKARCEAEGRFIKTVMIDPN